jgi:uncharacterized protein
LILIKASLVNSGLVFVALVKRICFPMTHTPHDLHTEFPDDGAVLHALKMNNAHFQSRADSYHDINREIHRIEAGVDAASDARIEELKKTRLVLLDDISSKIAAAKGTVT